jgi:hypothetical protein
MSDLLVRGSDRGNAQTLGTMVSESVRTYRQTGSDRAGASTTTGS